MVSKLLNINIYIYTHTYLLVNYTRAFVGCSILLALVVKSQFGVGEINRWWTHSCLLVEIRCVKKNHISENQPNSTIFYPSLFSKKQLNNYTNWDFWCGPIPDFLFGGRQLRDTPTAGNLGTEPLSQLVRTEVQLSLGGVLQGGFTRGGSSSSWGYPNSWMVFWWENPTINGSRIFLVPQ